MGPWARTGLLAASVALVAACGSEPAHVPPTPAAGRAAAAAPQVNPDLARFRASRTVEEVGLPRRLLVARAGVDAPIGPLGVAPDGSIEVPSDPDAVGWYADGPRPGQTGPSVLLGHVDSRNGPAVFYRLRRLVAGDEVAVVLADGTDKRFRVTRIASYAKERFPTDLVYFPTLQSELRLVTCGGSIDPRTGHYRDNLIVFATLVA